MRFKKSSENKNIYTKKDLASIDPKNIPQHIAIIMDGNRRWAKKRGLPVKFGHSKGAEVLKSTVEAAAELGVEIITAYAFSTENWLRPQKEIDVLLKLLKNYLINNVGKMLKEGILFDTIGDLSRFPNDIQDLIEETKHKTIQEKNFCLVLALNYGSRDEITRAVRKIAQDYSDNKIESLKSINEGLISNYLDSARRKDPELFIRTSGESRISNFLLWQISYTEIIITDKNWPSFTPRELLKSIIEYQKRHRRLGV